MSAQPVIATPSGQFDFDALRAEYQKAQAATSKSRARAKLIRLVATHVERILPHHSAQAQREQAELALNAVLERPVTELELIRAIEN